MQNVLDDHNGYHMLRHQEPLKCLKWSTGYHILSESINKSFFFFFGFILNLKELIVYLLPCRHVHR